MTRLGPTLAAVLALGVAPLPLFAQQARKLPPTNQENFRPLALPPANGMRRPSGGPGPEYWQQRADYDIDVALDGATHTVSGSASIRYVNQSPDTLREVWLQLEQNLFAPDSRGALVNSSTRWRGAFPGGGLELRRVGIIQDGRVAEPEYVVDDTRLRIDLPVPLAPGGGEVTIEVEWSFLVPEYGADRMGRLQGQDGWLYEIAQWYPRVYVYDDVHGWNPMPYIGQGEFYLEYGDFNVAITVPRDFIVAATGELTNAADVLTAEQQQRLERARTSEETVMIVAAGEIGGAATRPAGEAPLTWRFRASNVRDFAWAASRAFIWDAAGWEGVLLQSVYPREGVGTETSPGWEMSTQYLRHTIPHYSEEWFRYPYPTATNVAGIVGGMEYPMVVFCGVNARDQALFGVTDHEFGHSWFPMIVGSDERRYAWMDEGFNTFINHYSNLAYYGDDAQRSLRTRAPYILEQMLAPTADQPIATEPDGIRPDALGFLAYRKPGYGLIVLRELVVGPERFDAAFRRYIDEWAYKHPQPADFFRSIEEGTGEDLGWFWKGWFYSTDLLDQAVDSVTTTQERTLVHLSNREGLVMPAVLEITFDDGTTETRRLPVEIWSLGDTFTYGFDGTRPVRSVRLDPLDILPDVRAENDVWQARPRT
jgi:hypothetical protein